MAEENGTQAQPTPEETAAKATETAAAKVAADEAAAKAALLDGNGNPKSAEVLAEEAAAKDKSAENDDSFSKSQDALKTKVTSEAKQVEDLIVAAGIDPATLVTTSDAETGTISTANRIKLVEKHGEAIANLIEGSIKTIVTTTRQHATEKDNEVFKQVEKEFKGVTKQTGQETWKELAGWVKDNIATATRKEYNKMLQEGGIQAKMAVKEMVNEFRKKNDMTIPASLVEGEDAPGAAATFITRQEYRTALDKLVKSGHDYETSPQIKALNAKRERSMQSGK